MVDALRNHPSIVMWVPFNEGWGQHDTRALRGVAQVVRPDAPGRTTPAAGPTSTSAMSSTCTPIPGRRCRRSKPKRAAVLGEFGGLGLPHRRPHLARPEQLGLSHLHVARGAGRRVSRPAGAAPLSHRRRALGRGVHPDHRRRDRGQRPDDLRSRGRQAAGRRQSPPPRRSGEPLPKIAIVLPTSQASASSGAIPPRRRRRTGSQRRSTMRRGRRAPAASGPTARPVPSSGRSGVPPTSGCGEASPWPRHSWPTRPGGYTTTRMPRYISMANWRRD